MARLPTKALGQEKLLDLDGFGTVRQIQLELTIPHAAKIPFQRILCFLQMVGDFLCCDCLDGKGFSQITDVYAKSVQEGHPDQNFPLGLGVANLPRDI